ncbi:glycosyltransferase, partial [Priestia sp. BR_2]
PVSLLGGVKKPSSFMEKAIGKEVYDSFLDLVKPDIIHVHTLMGIHKEFFEIAKNRSIPIIFTTHDYFGICPKVNLIDDSGNICENFRGGEKCVTCNTNAYSLPLIYGMQSHLYKFLKENKVVKKLRVSKKKKTRNSIRTIKNSKVPRNKEDLDLKKEYVRLRNYYIEILHIFDEIHFNSEVSKLEYAKHILPRGEILHITHSDIKDNRMLKNYNEDEPLKIGFIGPLDEYKGFPLLRKSLLRLLEKDKKNWHLHLYGDDRSLDLSEKDESHISAHGRYTHNELKTIFSEIDVLVVPSVWKETFGFIGLEAVSYG